MSYVIREMSYVNRKMSERIVHLSLELRKMSNEIREMSNEICEMSNEIREMSNEIRKMPKQILKLSRRMRKGHLDNDGAHLWADDSPGDGNHQTALRTNSAALRPVSVPRATPIPPMRTEQVRRGASCLMMTCLWAPRPMVPAQRCSTV